MKVNKEIISSSKQYFTKIIPKSYPKLIEEMDKLIIKYKNQLEQLKSQKDFTDKNYNIYNTLERKQKIYKEIIKNNSEKYNNNNNYNNEEINKEQNYYSKSYRYNIKYNSKKLKNKSFNNVNDLSCDLVYEIENDNKKLDLALNLEKERVEQLLNLLMVKERETDKLKQQINNFQIKIDEIERKYENIKYAMDQQQFVSKNNNISNNRLDFKNKLNIDYNEINLKNEFDFNKNINSLNNNKKIIKLFFDLFNKNIDTFNKTEILKMPKFEEENYTEEKAILIAEGIDKLINKLIQDNKDLYNELLRIKLIDNKNIQSRNRNYIQKENDTLKLLIQKLRNENNILKNNIKLYNTKNISKKNSYGLFQTCRIPASNRNINYNHQHIIRKTYRHCTPKILRNIENNKNREKSTIEQLRIKINNLEKKFKNQTNS